ncbi:MAG: sialate O-acetylesterase, partial [Rubripirellula sp.]
MISADVTAEKPVKVFVLAGQSNMDGQADIRTLDFLGEDVDPKRASLLRLFKSDAGELMTRNDVWVANAGVYGQLQTGFGGRRNYDKLGNKIGPEYAFGYYMGEAFDEQVLLIKYAPGGKSLHVDFRQLEQARERLLIEAQKQAFCGVIGTDDASTELAAH